LVITQWLIDVAKDSPVGSHYLLAVSIVITINDLLAPVPLTGLGGLAITNLAFLVVGLPRWAFLDEHQVLVDLEDRFIGRGDKSVL